MSVELLESSLKEGFIKKHCALCGASLSSVLAEVPCVHWFVTPGARGFRIARLAPVFEMFERDVIISFLRVFAGSARIRAGAPAYREWVTNGVTTISIRWQRRAWLFEFDKLRDHLNPAVSDFDLTLFYDDIVMEKAYIKLVQRERSVEVTTTVMRQRQLAALEM